MANVKQIQIGNTTYDIEALQFIANDNLKTPAEWKSYIDSATGVGLQIVIDSKSSSGEYPATAPSASTMGKLYMVSITGQTAGTYTEFVTVDKGSSANPRYVWEKIGTTEADLTSYAKKTEAAKPGWYDTCFTTCLGSGGIALSGCVYVDGNGSTTGTYKNTFTTSSNGSQTATGTASVTGPCVANVTGSSGGTGTSSTTGSSGGTGTSSTTGSSGGTGTSATTGSGGSHTINGCNFTFNGYGHSHAVDGSDIADVIASHSYTPAGTIGGSQSVGTHTHTVSTTTSSCLTEIQAVCISDVMSSASVSNGVLSFNTTSVVNNIIYENLTRGSTGSAAAGGSHTINGSNFTFSGTAATLAHTAVSGSCVHTYESCVSGSIGGSVTVEGHTHSYTKPADHTHSYTAPAAHTHSYTAPANHTHSISVTTTSYTGTASVAVSNHTHTVNIGNHFHDINHKHSVGVDPITTA